VVRVIDSWRYGGRWWLGEPGRDYYLVATASGEELVLYRKDGIEAWTLALEVD
jgi:hypothetical protein